MIYLIISTDVWCTFNSYRVEGIATTLSHAIKMLKANKELLKPVIDNDGEIIIIEYKKNSFAQGSIVFNTQNKLDKSQVT